MFNGAKFKLTSSTIFSRLLIGSIDEAGCRQVKTKTQTVKTQLQQLCSYYVVTMHQSKSAR